MKDAADHFLWIIMYQLLGAKDTGPVSTSFSCDKSTQKGIQRHRSSFSSFKVKIARCLVISPTRKREPRSVEREGRNTCGAHGDGPSRNCFLQANSDRVPGSWRVLGAIVWPSAAAWMQLTETYLERKKNYYDKCQVKNIGHMLNIPNHLSSTAFFFSLLQNWDRKRDEL